MKKTFATILSIAALLTSCAHRPPAYDESTFNPSKEGIVYGTMKVNLDGKLASEQCDLHFSDDKTFYKTPIDSEGKFKFAGLEGEIYISGLKCNNDYFTFEEKVLSFTNKAGNKQTFIGEFEVTWQTGGINPWVTVGAALVGWIAVSRSAHKLTITNKSFTSRSYASAGDIRKSLIKIPYGLGPKHVENEQ